MSTRDYFEISPRTDCRRFGEIVERRLGQEDELSPEDAEFARRHARECPTCGKFSGALIGLKDAGPEPLGPRVLEENIVGVRNRLLRRRRFRRVSASLVAAAALLCLMFSVQYFRKAPRAEKPLPLELSSGMLEAAGEKLPLGAKIEPGRKIGTSRVSARLQVGAGLRIVLDRHSDVLPRRVDADLLELALTRGRMIVELNPAARTLKPAKLKVRTSQLDVVVKGTIFVVEAGGGNDRVHVLRGRVDVSFPQDAETHVASVSAGLSLAADEKRPFPLEPELEQKFSKLLGHDAPGELDAAPRGDEGDETEGKALTEPSAGADSGLSPTPPTPPTIHRAPRRETSKEDESLDALVRAARQCRAKRDWQCAARAYSRVLELFGHGGRSSKVLLPLAQIELDHLVRNQKALEHFQLYLEGSPSGALAQEARYGVCRALMALGRKEKARRELERFVELYPTSVYAGSARKWLETLRRD